MKIVFVTNLPSPYRVDFFNELSNYCELTVLYERKSASDRNSEWINKCDRKYKELFSNSKPVKNDESIGFDLIRKIKKCDFDCLLISGYYSPSAIFLILYCQINKIPYFIETDGGFNKQDKWYLAMIKKFLVRKAKGIFTTCDEMIDYYRELGYKGNIFKYPFSSIREKEILDKPYTKPEQLELRKDLGITGERIVVTVGRFVYGKGYDVLIKAWKQFDDAATLYIIGGKPTDEYINLINESGIKNIKFLDFMSHDELIKHYCAADLFVFPTRGDVWGLVVNEAMACGLPIITTNRCVAGVELVKNGQNGYVVEVDSEEALRKGINKFFSKNEDEISDMQNKSLEFIKQYTIENMAKYHIDKLTN